MRYDRAEARRCDDAQRAANAKLWRAIRLGALPDMRGGACADCGRTATVHDHRDYDRWWDVAPVCRGCNVKRGKAKPFEHMPFNTRAMIPKFSYGHEQHMGAFAASLHCLGEEL